MLEEIMSAGIAELGISVDGRAVERLRIYYDFLVQMNQVMNLTAITEESDAARLHFLDCAEIIKHRSISGLRIADVGTGAGFPGMVLKILCPDIKLTLLDSLDKRIGFLRELCEKLGFDDVSAIHCRAEEAPPQLRGKFDIVTSRAVARLNILSELCLPLVKPGGVFLAMKGPDFEQELDEAKPAIKLLGGRVDGAAAYTIPSTDVTHSIITVRKLSESPAKYPRRWAQIKKQPL